MQLNLHALAEMQLKKVSFLPHPQCTFSMLHIEFQSLRASFSFCFDELQSCLEINATQFEQ